MRIWILPFNLIEDPDPDPSFQIKAQNLEKVVKLAHIPYILACHLQTDADPAYHFDADKDPDPANYYDAYADLDPTTFQFDEDPDPDPSFQIKAQNLEKVLK